MRKSILALLFAGMILMSASAMAADVSITATVGNQAPTITFVNVCDGTCAATKSLAPATDVTIEVTVTDPNGAADIDTAEFSVEIYKGADTNGGTPDWDAIVVAATSGTRDGCTEAGTTYCLQVDTGDWTTKFLAGTADVYVYAQDNSAAPDSDEETGAITVSSTTGFTPDATTGTYSGSPNTTDNAFDNGQTVNAYVETTHNANVNIDVTADQSDLTDGGDTIGDDNVSWYLSDDAGSSTPFTGGADAVNSTWGRGTDPTSATFNLYMWLDIPANQPAGAYTGTLQILASAS